MGTNNQVRALKFFEKFIGGSTLLTSIKPRDAEAFVAHRLASGSKVQTVNKDIRTLRRIFNLAIDPRGYPQEGHPYIFIKPERFKLIKKREKAGTWNSRCEAINNVDRNFRVMRRRAGVAKCTLHDLRRSAITNWAKYLPIQVVQQLAGHSNISTTRRYYLTVRPEDITSANQVFNKIMEGVKQD